MASTMTQRSWIGLSLAALLLSAGCGGDDDGENDGGGADQEDGGETVTHECGTFDPNEPGDSVIPQDPASEEIVDACEALCDAMASIEGCAIDLDACVEDCRLESCDFCPGTLAPLAECRSEFFDPAACTCSGGVADCEVPGDCTELMYDTTQCGG
jgi:hypothetical protein